MEDEIKEDEESIELDKDLKQKMIERRGISDSLRNLTKGVIVIKKYRILI
jgi:hypothetical protein